MAGSEGRPRWWQRVLAAKRRGDAMITRLEALGIAEVNPNCGERRRAYKAAGLDGGDERG